MPGKHTKSKYTPELVEWICQALRLGATRRDAAAVARIHRDTFYQWLKEKPEFPEAVKKAEAEGVVMSLAKINKAASDDWRAAAWLLERRYLEEYGRRVERVQTVVSGPAGAPIGVEFYRKAAGAAGDGVPRRIYRSD
jgi:hypothetical protein